MFSGAISKDAAFVVTQDDVHSPHFASKLCRDVAHRSAGDPLAPTIELDCAVPDGEPVLSEVWRTATTLVRCLARGSSGGRLILRCGPSDSQCRQLTELAEELMEAWRDCGVEAVVLRPFPVSAHGSPLESSPFAAPPLGASNAA